MTQPERRGSELRRAVFETMHEVQQCDGSWPSRDWTNRILDSFWPLVEAALNAQQGAAQREEWKLVPREPTRKMLDAGCAANVSGDVWYSDGIPIWQAMYDAAPTPDSVQS